MKMIVVGNGLGMAIDPQYFAFNAGMNHAWNHEDRLTQAERELIASAVPSIDPSVGPSHEDELLGVQIAQLACELVKTHVGPSNVSRWLTEDAQNVEDALGRYSYTVAEYFHLYKDQEENPDWAGFISHFIKYLIYFPSHIATLNYDNLLYREFVKGRSIDGRTYKLCNGFNSVFRDGYTPANGFEKSNFTKLPRTNGMPTARYLHLHGSPLFYTSRKGGEPKKRYMSEIGDLPEGKSHIVLAHGSLKESIIANSPLLKMYWDQFKEDIKDVDEFIVFGYAGGDRHLNKLIKNKESASTRVVEWSGAHNSQIDAEHYWRSELGDKTSVVRLDNLLSFRDWGGSTLTPPSP